MGSKINPELIEVRKIIGSWIKEIRESKGMSQTQLAKEMDIDQSTISKIESGQWAVSIDNIARLSNILDFYIFLIPKDSKDPLAKTMRKRWEGNNN